MIIANIYRNIKQILRDSNAALAEKGGNECSSLNEVVAEINNLEINKLPYLLGKQIMELRADDFGEGDIKDYAFYNCKNLAGELIIPDSITGIGSSAFSGCASLTSVTIPYGVISIGDSAFYYCVSLSSITIPDSVTSIGSLAFDSCYNLTSITIPDSVTSIGGNSFYYCYNLETIYLSSFSPPTLIGDLGTNLDKLSKIYVPAGSRESYTSATNWSNYADIIFENIEEVI